MLRGRQRAVAGLDTVGAGMTAPKRKRGARPKPPADKRGADGRRTSDAWTAAEWQTVAALTPEERRRRILTNDTGGSDG